MTFKFRSRIFLYLLLLLAIFIVSQSTIYLGVELLHWRANPYQPLAEGLEVVATAMGLMLFLVLPWIGAAWLISRLMVRPLRRVAGTARRIREGQWSERIETGTMPDDETRSLAETVNAAFDGYAAAMRRLERFSGDAAHQLRTPIAAMRGMGEVALSRSRTAEEYRDVLETMLGELDRLTRTVEQLLQLSRLEAGALRGRFGPVSLRTVAEQVQQIYQPLAEARGSNVNLVLDSKELRVHGSAELLIELLGNLVDNALRYTPAGGEVRMEIATGPDDIRLAVTDSGPGIPEEYAHKIFDRFAQMPGGESGAAGLGLSLAAEIAAVHGGELILANPGKPGARFECRLPAAAGA